MLTVFSLETLPEIEGCVVALGNFDGVHVGHQHVINAAINLSKKLMIPSVVLTFRYHPSKIVSECEVEYLTPFEEKARLLKKMGVDILIALDFTEAFSSTTRESFFLLLKDQLKVKGISVGYNYRFGKSRLGDVDYLSQICRENEVTLLVSPAISVEGKNVSSSLIRNMLKENNIVSANSMLGYFYQIEGIVIHGRKVGKSLLGFPTANVQELEKLLPQNGVFGVSVRVENDKKRYFGVMNVGNNPTLNQVVKQSVEVNIFDFDQDIYGAWIHVEIMKFLRNEEKLSGLEALKDKIANDVREFKEYLNFLNIGDKF